MYGGFQWLLMFFANFSGRNGAGRLRNARYTTRIQAGCPARIGIDGGGGCTRLRGRRSGRRRICSGRR